ncbi:MAG: hypothetical protein HY290_33760 [Planctomycetia bacterium]|nr:hypothetical protein [Planctomycetia bacterium]
MSDPAAISLAILGGLTAIALAASAGWLIGSFFSRMRPVPPRHCGPLHWLADRSRRFWIISMTLPMLYGASFGPACWISSRVQPDGQVVNAVYPQLVMIMWNRSSLGYESLLWRYVTVGNASGDNLSVGLDTRGRPRISF